MYDLVIVGLGPAGLTAGIYAGRRGLKTLLIGEVLGGQQSLAHVVENYPGIESITGRELSERMKRQCERFGCDIVLGKVASLELSGKTKKVVSDAGTFEAEAVILATGGRHRKLNVEGEDRFLGKGVSYCAACDGPLFRNKKVAVIGGSDSAVTTAVYLSEIASETYLIHRRDSLRAEESNQRKLRESDVKIIWNSVVQKILGSERLEGLELRNVKTGEISVLKVDGVFIEIGMVPTTELARAAGVKLREDGYIEVNEKMETSLEGVFAAGEVTGCVPQIVVAAGQGAVAATSAYLFLKGVYGKKADWGKKV